MCPAEDLRQVRAPADAGGLPLPPALPLEVRGGRGRGAPPPGRGAQLRASQEHGAAAADDGVQRGGDDL